MRIDKLLTPLGPLIFLGLYFGVLILLRSKIPDTPTFIEAIRGLYESYGYPLVFLGAFLEAAFLIGFYVPGATVVLLGAALSKTGVVYFPFVLLLGTLGLCLGFILNYILGQYGWYPVLTRFGLEKGIEEAKRKIEKHGVRALFLGYFHPGSASFLSTAAGILKMPFARFISASFLAQSFWSLFWGSLAYFFGLPLVEFLIKYFIFVLLGVGAVWLIRKLFKR